MIIALGTIANAQLYVGGEDALLVPGNKAPYFINANNAAGDRKTVDVLEGKGLYFPRVDLSQVTSFGDFSMPVMPVPLTASSQFSTYFDGLVVYNIGTATSINSAIGKLDKELKPGFWYYPSPLFCSAWPQALLHM